ncbi:hypothetical protein J1N35_042285 [Gossypium stocksii]|uniref:Uncharacterized protein n=1 Tax=Gossypium stocksii TaxID=47602 RepID=A0A9D3ZK56_9ROSI|nr:hypothetical protein J1N35_042285 [Gossypium stocksii]
MAEIGIVALASHHTSGWKVDTPLPSRFTVKIESGVLEFRSRPHERDIGKNVIYGKNWNSFVESNLEAVVTLYARQQGENFHNLQVMGGRGEELDKRLQNFLLIYIN